MLHARLDELEREDRRALALATLREAESALAIIDEVVAELDELDPHDLDYVARTRAVLAPYPSVSDVFQARRIQRAWRRDQTKASAELKATSRWAPAGADDWVF